MAAGSMEAHQDHIVLNVPVNVAIVPVPSSLRRTAPYSSSSSSSSLSPIATITDCRFSVRPGPFDSQRCILIEITISVILIIASVMVLALSRNEKPHSLITLWIVGYASGCLATLPNLCLRYRRRLRIFVEVFEFVSRCFFLCWITFGMKLIHGHLSSSDAPNQYRLCIAIVATTLISYASCIIALWCHILCLACFSHQTQTRGASFETISALPMYKFKAINPTEGNGSNYDCQNPSKSSGEDGTVKERSVSAKDAMCCICLSKYEDNEHLRELPCTHYFHVECVDKWLIIKASCPLCKHEIGQ